MKVYLKDNAFATIYPACPAHLTKKRAPRRKTNTSAAERKEAAKKREDERREKEIKENTIQSFEEISVNFTNKIFNQCKLESHPMMIVDSCNVAFCKWTINSGDLKPVVKYRLTIHSNLSFQYYRGNKRIPHTRFAPVGITDGKIRLYSQVISILEILVQKVTKTRFYSIAEDLNTLRQMTK